MKSKSWLENLTKEERQDYDHQMALVEKEMFIKGRHDELNRGRSITVGKTNDYVEIQIRTVAGKHAFYIMSPEETTEFIHQLASNIGCHISIKPRDDFASYRLWKDAPNEDLAAKVLLQQIEEKKKALQLLNNMIQENTDTFETAESSDEASKDSTTDVKTSE